MKVAKTGAFSDRTAATEETFIDVRAAGEQD